MEIDSSPVVVGQFVAVAGNIAVGKSGLTQSLARAVGARPLLESVTENPFFDRFYTDPERWAFHSQVAFATEALHRHLQATGGGPVVQDRTAYETHDVFARVQFQAGHLSEGEMQILGQLRDCVSSLPRQPDLLLYLHASTPSLVSRVAERDRVAERHVDSAYLDLLQTTYEQFIREWTLSAVLRVDTDKHDLRDPDELIPLLDRVAAMTPDSR